MTTSTEQLLVAIKAVMLATDFHQSSRLALTYAAAFAKHFGADLITLNAFEFGPHSANVELLDHVPSRVRRNAEARLATFSSEIEHLGIPVRYEAIEGSVPSSILTAIERDRIDLLVLGTDHIHLGLDHLLVGSKTEALLLNAPCPTFTIGPGVHQEWTPALKLKDILYISDMSSHAEASMPFVHGLAAAVGATVEVVRVPRTPSHEVAQTIRAAVNARGASSVVALSVEPCGYVQRHLHTSMAYELLTSAKCPLLTIPVSAGWLTDHLKRPK